MGGAEGGRLLPTATTDKVKTKVKKVYENELRETLRTSISKTLNEFVVSPYKSLIEDYVEKTNYEAELCNERIERIIDENN